MILIYDFMPNGTLDDHLHKDGTCLNWIQRLIKETPHNGRNSGSSGALSDITKKHDSRVKTASGVFSVTRMIKWPFISNEVNSARNDTVNEEDNIYIASSSKEHSDDHLEVSSASNIRIAAHDLKEFSLYDLKTATRNFKRDMKLGEGEFGAVFEGWINTNTSSMTVDGPVRIAIRWFHRQNHIIRISIRWFHRRNHIKEFVDILLREFNHPNLIKVLGYCFEYNNMYLVYEFMENGSLASHLFKDKIRLSWKTRVQIAKGVAEALSFLLETQPDVHNHPLELHHILLDKNFNAKIFGFESEKLVYGDSYMKINDDPLYYLIPPGNSVYEGIIRPFGVVLIHILTGECDSEIGITKLQETMRTRKNRKASMKRALDPRLPNVDDTTIKEAIELAEVALRCVDGFYSLTTKTLFDELRI